MRLVTSCYSLLLLLLLLLGRSDIANALSSLARPRGLSSSLVVPQRCRYSHRARIDGGCGIYVLRRHKQGVSHLGRCHQQTHEGTGGWQSLFERFGAALNGTVTGVISILFGTLVSTTMGDCAIDKRHLVGS
jgi:hypothetical protein